MIINLSNGATNTLLPDFTFTANGTTYAINSASESSSVADVYLYQTTGTDWVFYAMVSGEITFTEPITCDLYLQGSGKRGSTGVGTSRSDGGNGGRRLHKQGVTFSGTQTITITAGSESRIGTHSSADEGYSESTSGQNGGYPFGDQTAVGPDGVKKRRYGAGGGKGGYANVSSGNSTDPTSGGNYGGGDGGKAYATPQTDPHSNTYYCTVGLAAFGYGSGGGGGGGTKHSGGVYAANGGAGKTGFVGLRSPR